MIPAGGTALVFSDGLSDALENTAEDNPWGRVCSALAAIPDATAQRICDRLWDEAQAAGAGSDMQADDFVLVGTHPEGAMTPAELGNVPRLALVMGNEHDGICAELAAACSERVRIPMRGFVESLNVSVCAAILLAGATRGRAGDLPPARRQELYARGLFRTVPRAGEVLIALKSAAGPGPTPPGGEGWKGPVT